MASPVSPLLLLHQCLAASRVWHTVAYFEGTILLDLCAVVGYVGSSRPVRRVVVQRATVINKR